MTALDDQALLAAVAAAIDHVDPVPAALITSCQDLNRLADGARRLLAAIDEAFPPARPPSGCGLCGIAERGHYRQFTAPHGWHRYVQPSQEQIKTRMRRRRRHALKTKGAK